MGLLPTPRPGRSATPVDSPRNEGEKKHGEGEGEGEEASERREAIRDTENRGVRRWAAEAISARGEERRLLRWERRRLLRGCVPGQCGDRMLRRRHRRRGLLRQRQLRWLLRFDLVTLGSTTTMSQPDGREMSSFDSRVAYRIVRELSSRAFAGRRVGTPGHDRAAKWIEDRMTGWGFRTRRHGFAYPLSLVDIVEEPRARIQPHGAGSREELLYRYDFAEHPSSGPSAGVAAGAITEWGPSASFHDRWAIAKTRRESRSLKEQALAAASGGGVGMIVPFAVNQGAVIFKQPIAGDAFPLPTLFLRRELLFPNSPSRLEVDIRLQRRPLEGANLVAELPGSEASLANRPLLVGAHYDAVGDDPGGLRFPGASDNASGLAVILEVARTLGRLRSRLKRPVWFVAFDAEEAGAYGSRALADELQHPGIEPLVINVDLAALSANPVVVEGSPNSRSLLTVLDTSGRRSAIPLMQGPVQSDNRQFAARGFPTVGLGSGGVGYHTPLDTVDRVEPEALRRVGVLLLGAIRDIAG